MLLGAAVYRCEGEKSKPWRRNDRLTVVNRDPCLLDIFLRFLESVGVGRDHPTYRILIHETADADGAAEWWAGRLGLDRQRFHRQTIERHVPTTVRRKTGADYRGCLVVSVPQSRELYWRVEGVMRALAGGGR